MSRNTSFLFEPLMGDNLGEMWIPILMPIVKICMIMWVPVYKARGDVKLDHDACYEILDDVWV